MAANLSEMTYSETKLTHKFHDGSFASVVDTESIQSIEKKLLNIFEENEKLDKPVFHFVNKGAIQKLAYFLSGAVKRPVTIGIAGATASGKSTFALDIIECINQNANKLNHPQPVTRVNTPDIPVDTKMRRRCRTRIH